MVKALSKTAETVFNGDLCCSQNHFEAVYMPVLGMAAVLKLEIKTGATVAQLVADLSDQLPPDFALRGSIAIGNHEVPAALWGRVKVKPNVRVTLSYTPLGGGGGGGSKAILGIVIALAATLASGFILSGGLFATLGGAFAAGSIGAQLAAAGVGIAASLAARAISGTPGRNNGGAASQQQQNGPASLSGNVLAQGASLPRVLGTRRIFPPLITEPIVERIGEDEFAEAIFALDGPHLISKIRVGAAPLDTAEDIDLEIREGRSDDTAISLIRRFGKSRNVGLELPGHKIKTDKPDNLDDQANPQASAPKWRSVAPPSGSGADTPDEIWLHFVLPEGLSEPQNNTKVQTIPLRLRMRIKGTNDWFNLPELHFSGNEIRSLKPTVRLKFNAGVPEHVPALAASTGWSAAFAAVPAATSPSIGWQAHGSFYSAGATQLFRGNEAVSGVRRVTPNGVEMILNLDAAAFPKGRYEIEMLRGYSFRAENFSAANYQIYGAVRDAFLWDVNSGVATIPRGRSNLAEMVQLQRAVSIVNRHPVMNGQPAPGVALIAMRARNRAVDDLSVEASGLVMRFDGVAFADFGPSSNPADHYAHVLTGGYGARQLPLDLLDIGELSTWRDLCTAKDWRCDLLTENVMIDELLGQIAACGFARPSARELWGVIRDRDRSAEVPVQMFGPRNANNFVIGKAFELMPDAVRAVWLDAANDDARAEQLVFRTGREGIERPLIEEMAFDGVTRESFVLKRAAFDLLQAEKRSALYSWSAPAEAIRCTRGDMVLLAHELFSPFAGTARIMAVTRTATQIIGVLLDAVLPRGSATGFMQIADVLKVDDILEIGVTSALTIRRSDGVLQIVPLAAGAANLELIFQTPLNALIDDDGLPLIRAGCLVSIGPQNQPGKRVIINDITPKTDMSFELVAVDEASEIFSLSGV